MDIVVMKNGDRLTGEIKSLDAGVLYVNMPYILGTSSIDWSQVASLESTQLFIVKTENGSVYRGILRTAEGGDNRPVKIEILDTLDKPITIDQAQIVNIAETADEFWQRFSGTAKFGATYSKGNETVQYALGSEIQYLRERWSAGADWNSTLSTTSRANVATRNEVTLTGRRLLPWQNYFYAGLADFLQSSVQGIRLETSVGAGIGRYIENSNQAAISIIGGFAWQNTQYNQTQFAASTQNLAAGLIATNVRLFKFNKTNLNVTAILFPALTDPGRVKFSVNSTYNIKITRDLSWNISFYGNWENQPPPHFAASDYGSSAGLSWTFGMK